jgi:hypothetical protein
MGWDGMGWDGIVGFDYHQHICGMFGHLIHIGIFSIPGQYNFLFLILNRQCPDTLSTARWGWGGGGEEVGGRRQSVVEVGSQRVVYDFTLSD